MTNTTILESNINGFAQEIGDVDVRIRGHLLRFGSVHNQRLQAFTNDGKQKRFVLTPEELRDIVIQIFSYDYLYDMFLIPEDEEYVKDTFAILVSNMNGFRADYTGDTIEVTYEGEPYTFSEVQKGLDTHIAFLDDGDISYEVTEEECQDLAIQILSYDYLYGIC